MNIIGIDEVGHGAIAGPIAICTYMSDIEDDLLYYRDSKGLTRKQRKKYARLYHELALEYYVVQVDNFEIDRTTAMAARNLAIDIALAKFSNRIDRIIVDGEQSLSARAEKKYQGKIEYIPQGDKLHWQIAASSIMAKISRDEFMHTLAEQYPAYSWKHNVGYSDPVHLAAIQRFGPTPYHRLNNKAVQANTPGDTIDLS